MTNNMTNLAALLDEAGKPFRVGEAPIDPPDTNEVLVKIHAVAVNPVDHYRQNAGMFITSYPWIVGCDGAGIVEQVGTAVTHVKPGDRVTVLADEFHTRKSTHSAFQQYVTVRAAGVSTIPDSISFADASVLPLGLTTAAGMLYETVTLNLTWPEIAKKASDNKEVLIVWGGSSSVGVGAIQLAKASGYHAIGISSSRNFDLMTQSGSDANFDYHDGNMVDELCKFVEDKKWVLAGVAAAVMGDEVMKGCGQIATRLPGHKFVSTCLGRGVSPVPEMPEGVKASNCKSSLKNFSQLC